jgi:hypothetical protein
MTVPRNSARSVITVAASAANQKERMCAGRFRWRRRSSGRDYPVAMPSLPDRYCRSIAMIPASQTTQSML